MLKKFARIPNPEELRAYLTDMLPLFEKDISSYAPGRYRLWLFHEALLGRKEIKLAHFDQRLWDFCQRTYPGSNIALLTYNGNAQAWKSNGTIRPHRDDTYAIDKAIGCNLGSASFLYNPNRSNTDTDLCDRIPLSDGDIYSFNCKHLHGVAEASSPRFSLNIWKLKEDSRYPGFKPLF